jgi:hypothetical protein
MIHLLNDAIVISDRHSKVDEGKKTVTEADEKDETGDEVGCTSTITNPIQKPQNEFIVISDNARLPFQEDHQLKFTASTDRPERRFSERAEMKRETRWSSLNASNPTSAGLTLPLRHKSSVTPSFDYSNLPLPKVVHQRNVSDDDSDKSQLLSRTNKTPTHMSLSNDTIPTYPRSRRRSSA